MLEKKQLKRTFALCIILILFSISLTSNGSGYNVKYKAKNGNYSNDVTPDIGFVSIESDEWPMFRHDTFRTGYSTSDAPNTNNTKWIQNVSGNIEFCSPVISDNRLYIASVQLLYSNFYCIDADTGEIIWEIKGSRTWSTPAIAEGRVVIGYGLYSDEGLVSCFDAFTGKWLWSIKPDKGVKSSPVIFDGKVYVGSNVGRVYCIDLDEGFLHWRYLKGGEFESSPSIVDGKLFIGSKDKNVYCLDAETGNEIWIRSVEHEIHLSSPLVYNQRVYIGTYDDVPERGHVFCLNANNGDIIWEYLTGGWIDSSPAIFEDKLYIGSRDSNFYCLDAIYGNIIWDFNCDGSIRSSPAVADGKVYFGSGKGVFCLNAGNGNEIWKYTSGCVFSSPAISGGKLYIGIYKNIYCFYDDEDSDLNCKGRLDFFDIKPKSTLRTSFKVYNVGKPGSNLNWEIESYPKWGNWSSNPSFGVDLKPEDGEFIVELEVIVPEEGHTVFEGKLKIINSDDPDDFDSLFITIATNRVKSPVRAIPNGQLFRFIEPIFFMFKELLHI